MRNQVYHMKNKVPFIFILLAAFSICSCSTINSNSIDSSSNISSNSTSYSESSGSSSSNSSSSSNQSNSQYSGYYSSISDSMSGGMNGTLRVALTNLIKPKAYYTYSGSSANGLSTVLQEADADPDNSSNMIFFYTQESVKKQAAGTWNREHTWPQSLSDNLYGKTGGGTDILHIRPTYTTTNSTRGNLKFGDCTGGTEKIYSGIKYATVKSGYFEPMDSVKGDCARIVLYMWVCYFANRNTPITNVAQSVQLMVEWSKLDPPSKQELNRNDFAEQSKQNNRNPFVDHPEWVDKIFAN